MSKIYHLQNISIQQILSMVEQNKIAIPEIQRPFVWKKSKIRDLIDSLYNGYPVGYIITWENPTATLKGGGDSYGKSILIDGQQRITALRAAISGEEIITKNYKKEHVAISFNPITEEFRTKDQATERGSEWIPDIREILSPNFSNRSFMRKFEAENHLTDDEADIVDSRILKIRQLPTLDIGRIEIENNVEIEIVNEIFNRINSSGVQLSSADFAMSRIATFEQEPGDKFGMNIRKTIDYFSELGASESKELLKDIQSNDTEFSNTKKFEKISWIGGASEIKNIYRLNYNDILLIASLAEFRRGDIGDLVSLLSGRDFEARNYNNSIKTKSFQKLESILCEITKEWNLKNFVQNVLLATGYNNEKLIRSKNIVNYLYAIYLLLLKLDNESKVDIERYLRKLLLISVMTGRTLSSFNSTAEEDIKKISNIGIKEFVKSLERSFMGENFWNVYLVNEFNKTNTGNQFWSLFVAIKGGEKGDLYVNIRVKADKKFTREGDLILSEEKISMIDAALGTEIEIETVDGPLTIKIPAGTQSHTDFKLSGHGVPHLQGEKRGAHIVTIIVETPTRLSKKQKDLLREFSKAKKGIF